TNTHDVPSFPTRRSTDLFIRTHPDRAQRTGQVDSITKIKPIVIADTARDVEATSAHMVFGQRKQQVPLALAEIHILRISNRPANWGVEVGFVAANLAIDKL